MHIGVWDWDRLSRNDFMGSLSFSVGALLNKHVNTSGWFILLDEHQGKHHAFPSHMDEKVEEEKKFLNSKSSRFKSARRAKAAQDTKISAKDYHFLKVLGQGSFGKVFLAQEKAETAEVGLRSQAAVLDSCARCMPSRC